VEDCKYDSGLHFYTQACDTLKRLFGSEHLKIARIYSRIGGILLLQSKPKEAINYFHISFSLFSACDSSENTRDAADAMKGEGDGYKMSHSFPETLRCYLKSLEIWKKICRRKGYVEEIAYLYAGLSLSLFFFHTRILSLCIFSYSFPQYSSIVNLSSQRWRTFSVCWESTAKRRKALRNPSKSVGHSILPTTHVSSVYLHC